MSTLSGSGPDPRLSPPPPEPPMPAIERPAVATAARGAPVILWVLVFALLGVIVFLWLNSRREGAGDPLAEGAGPAVREQSAAVAPAPQPLPANIAPAAQGPMYAVPAPQFTNNAVPMAPGAPAAMAALPGGAIPAPYLATATLGDRRKAPAVVVDLGGGLAAPPPAEAAAITAARAAMGQATDAADEKAVQLSGEEQFAERVAATGPERARATALRNLDSLVPQGAMISAVLETAINSDLPGYTRAVVSRDVKSFDGSTVLIPRGSRLIGQYKSGVALGASRVFVIWTRVLRPDGVTVQLASPGADSLGRAGMSGEVDRHFVTRFGGAILLSVINAGMAAVSRADSAQVYIGSTADAANVAAAAFNKDGAAPPTIRTPQGAAVRVFVARDLDFSGVR